MDEVVRRGNAYLEAGATMIFIDGMTDKELARQAVTRIRGPVAINVVEGGKTPARFTFAEMQEMGLARVSLPGTLLLGAIHGMRQALATVAEHGYVGGPGSKTASFDDLKQLSGFEKIFELEQRYLSGLKPAKR